jgi:FAD/FMN-containing dehydrogenase
MSIKQHLWHRLERRFRGRLVVPKDGALYDKARRVFNARIAQYPLAIAFCVTPEDVVACIQFCESAGVKAVCRCGGHGALGFSTRSDQLIIDMSALQTVSVDLRNKTVTVGGGAYWGQVDLATYPRGYASPGGGCPQVGVGGLAQGGGLGPIARSHGLTIDNLIEAEVVTGRDCQTITVNECEEPELFWALRGGGGGNFGAVARFTFRLHPITNAFMAGTVCYNWESDTRKMLQFYREWMRSNGDDRLTLLPIIGFDFNADPTSLLSVIYNGDWEEGYKYWTKICRDFGAPVAVNSLLGPTTLPAFTASESSTAWPGLGQYWKSGFLKNDFPDAAIDTMMTWFEKAPKPAQAKRANTNALRAPDLTFGFIESLGGRIRERGATDTAFFWRENLFSFTVVGVYPPSDTELAHATEAWAAGFRDAMDPFYAGGVYVNYMQDGPRDWKRAYYGDNFDRLHAAKREYDPGHLFFFPQDLLQL